MVYGSAKLGAIYVDYHYYFLITKNTYFSDFYFRFMYMKY